MRETYEVYIQQRTSPGRLGKPQKISRTVGPKIPGKITYCGRDYFWRYTDETTDPPFVTYADVRV